MTIRRWALAAALGFSFFTGSALQAWEPSAAPTTTVSDLGVADCGSACWFDSHCGPLWKARANVIWLDRRDPRQQALVVDDNGNTVFDANEFDFKMRPGFEVGLSRQIGAAGDVEVRYFMVDSWRAQAAGHHPTAGGAILTNPPTQFGGPGGSPGDITADYSSRLYSGEVNVGRQLNDVIRVFAGFRMMELNENLDGRFFLAQTFAYDVDVNNHLYGFQLGSETMLWNTGRLRLESTGRVGVFGVRATQDTDVTQPPGTAFSTASARDNRAAWLLESGLAAAYQVNSNLAVRGGLQLLWIDGVALAPDQIANTGDLGAFGAVAPATIDQSDVLYRGAFLGLEYTR